MAAVLSPSLRGTAKLSEWPVCTILGGPNGSGKSSIYAQLGLAGRFINADIIARQIRPDDPESASIAAGRLVLRELDRLVAQRMSFVYETTLSSRQSVDLMKAARAAGFEVALAFVVLRDADLHVERVAARVASGGHNIPEASIRRRFESAFVRLVEAIRLADAVTVFDNSDLAGPGTLVRIATGAVVVSRLVATESLHRRVASCVAEALGVEISGVFRT